MTSYKVDPSLGPVLVTGATGYVAGVLIQQLLEAGVTVHATVRDVSKKEKFQYIQSIADKTTGSIQFFNADLLTDGSFYEAMQGCVIVFHTASPFFHMSKDPENDLIVPAVKGTENVLNTATQTKSVRKVIVTSSITAVSGDASDGYNPLYMGSAKMLTEEHWNRTSNFVTNPYCYSKALAEIKAWTIAGSQNQWKLITILPGMVFGPGLKYHSEATSYELFLQICGNNNSQYYTGVPPIGMGIVDIRDVAKTHIAAAYTESAHGRYLCVGQNSSFAEVAQALRTKYSSSEYPIAWFTVPLPNWMLYFIAPLCGDVTHHYVWNNFNWTTNYDSSKSIRELGIQYHTLQETVCDMYQQLIDWNIVSSFKDLKNKGKIEKTTDGMNKKD